GDVNGQTSTGDRRRGFGYYHACFFCRPAQGGALHNQRYKNDKEGHIEKQLRMFQPGHEGEHCQNNGNCTAQTYPGDEGAFLEIKSTERQQANEDGERTSE